MNALLAAVPLAWLQLVRDKVRLLVALLGVAFAVLLMFMQLGFQDAMFESCVRYHENLRYDLVMLSPRTESLIQMQGFSRRRLHQVRGTPGVAGVTELYVGQSEWRNPDAPAEAKSIFVIGFDPADDVFEIGGIAAHRQRLQLPDVVLFDEHSRPEFGPVAALFQAGAHGAGQRGLEVEVANRRLRVVGLFQLGTSFGIDGSLITSELNFRRLFPQREAGRIELGLIHLQQGVDPATAIARLRPTLPEDVLVLTRAEFVDREVTFWQTSTPIGYVLGMGVVMGLVVGGIIVYQILFADVSEHLREYATLKAMGYTDAFLSGVVLREAVLLAVLGFVPGVAASAVLYAQAGEATRLPLELNGRLVAIVLGLTVVMCAVAGAMALRKVRTADPADVF